MSLTLCLHVVSQAPQNFRFSEMQDTCDSCFAQSQSIHSVTSLILSHNTTHTHTQIVTLRFHSFMLLPFRKLLGEKWQWVKLVSLFSIHENSLLCCTMQSDTQTSCHKHLPKVELKNVYQSKSPSQLMLDSNIHWFYQFKIYNALHNSLSPSLSPTSTCTQTTPPFPLSLSVSSHTHPPQ